MNILHIIFTLKVGGAETLLIDLVNEQVKNNKVSLMIINKDYSIKLLKTIDEKVNVIILDRHISSLNPIKWLKSINIIHKLNPDIIHSHDSKAIFFLPFSFYKRALLTVHAINLPLKGIKLYTKLVAISKAVSEDVYKRKHLQSIVIYNGIKIDNISHNNVSKEGPFSIVQVGRLQHEIKGQHILLEALAIIKNKYNITYFTCNIIGSGSLTFLQDKIKEFGLEKEVELLGERNREYIYTHLHDYNLLVQPSLYEGFGLTIIEGMAANIPVLVSNIPGPMEIIQYGEFGYYFKRGDAHDCAKELVNIMNDSHRSQKALRSLEYCKNNFSLEKTSSKYETLYKTLISCK